ncbi:MAG: PBP1A family penicillin-binding protein [Rhodospirillaceae bacterium]|nr:PBP1A family penicillin-binding protein [Rhodospirillaceae bacterium]MCA8933328.1 PBP1A family penicillin-binding protein [Rhodospirillaceae bacterium]
MFSAFTIILSFVSTIGMGVLDLPDHTTIANYRPPQVTRVYAADGELVHEYYTENRVWVPIEALPPHVTQAFISAEDQNFREHFGIDPLGLARAALNNVINVVSGRRLEGGSTITQQVAKNLLLNSEVSLLRKVREVILAVLIEMEFTKDEILEIYLNEIYLGRGAYGIGTASARYFGVSPAELTLAQAAYLAALPKAPNNYHPIFRHDAAVARRNYVLDRMVEDGAITEEEAEAARNEPLEVREDAALDQVDAAYFSEDVRRTLQREYGSDGLYEGGLSVLTTLDPRLQQIADEALRDGLIEYDRRHGWRGPLDNMETIVRQQLALDEARAAEAAAAEAGDQVAEAEEPAAPTFDIMGALRGLGGGGGEDEDEADAEPEEILPLWQMVLAEIDPPAGAGDWLLAVVLDVGNREARIGLADGEIGTIPYDEVRWAAPTLARQTTGYPPQRVSDVLALGDVILVEPLGPRITAVPLNDPDGVPDARSFALRQIPNVQGAVVALNPDTGAVLAMSGGYSYAMSEFNRVTQAYRQPGSAIKPFVYLAALQNGYSPNSVLLDVPVEVEQGLGQGLWRPENYSHDFEGQLPLRVGVERSRNVMTIRLILELGIEPVAEVTNALDIYDDMPLLPSMGLGAGETTLLRLANAYAAFPNGGVLNTPHLIERIQDRDGNTLFRAAERRCAECMDLDWQPGMTPPSIEVEQEPAVDPVAAYQMVSILRGVVLRGTAASLAYLPYPLAGKTGTTSDYRDAWFVGFAPELVVGVYVGFDSPRTLGGESGSSAAVPIFGQVMETALVDRPNRGYATPDGVQTVWIDQSTGYRAEVGAPGAIAEYIRDDQTVSTAPSASVFEDTADQALQGTGGLY